MDGEWSMEISKKLIGKKIRNADVDGHRVIIKFEDGDVFNYYASDGGYSCYGIEKDLAK